MDYCTIQNNVTSLAVISGYILRDMYFAERFHLSTSQQRRSDLEAWLANLPHELREQVETGVVNSSRDRNEAVVSSWPGTTNVYDLLTMLSVQLAFYVPWSMDVTH